MAANNKQHYLKTYPAVAFYFRVAFGSGNEDDGDSRFQSVAGLNVELETENRKEGGENRFEYALPIRTKYPNLVLKKGLIQSKSLRKWVIDNIYAITNMASDNPFKRLITPKDLTVTLLNPEGEELMVWNIVKAFPKKWSISDLNAEQNALAIETIELQYQYFTVKDKVNAS
ncbi:glycerol acyltransferase [Chitinophaga caeni]|uniref:Glycerol acyltransferase n=1 Tax=Chitinophaga caeni TaxID=2029983 RepID=A0A291QWG7_9BACT|nr:phage tail protein [Chitinophaga caeni]ATL48379.1 glycerol acyltransferase [Chitinophaga caeni]